jgi:hypothetical protein
MKVLTIVVSCSFLVGFSQSFTTPSSLSSSSFRIKDYNSKTLLYGWFDNNWKAQGSGKDDLDEQWQRQQEILQARRKPKADRDKYFEGVEKRRKKASDDFRDKWAWQTKTYGKGEDPLNEWKKRRADGTISDLENQYGDPKKIGGIPLPMASFGVGGEFGVGGKFDNGGRFDLRLPYADQGYVDEDADVMGKLGKLFFFSDGKSATSSTNEKKTVKNNNKSGITKNTNPPAKSSTKWPWEK